MKWIEEIGNEIEQFKIEYPYTTKLIIILIVTIALFLTAMIIINLIKWHYLKENKKRGGMKL